MRVCETAAANDLEMTMKFEGKATVLPAKAETTPDVYLVIGEGNPVLRIGSKNDFESMQEFADALNEWAGK